MSSEKILILGNHRNALTVARQLGKEHQVFLGGTDGPGHVQRSRFVTGIWPLPGISSDAFSSSLEELLQSLPEAPVLFPIGDAELYGLLRVPSVIEGRVSVVMPSPDIVSRCLDKAALLDLASILQIPQADYRKVNQLSELEAAVRAVGCPCIVKSDNQLSLAFGRKTLHVSDPDELIDVMASGPEPEHGLIVQALASGLRHNVYFAADNGRIAGAMEARVLRTNIFDGSGFTVESESVPLSAALRDYTEKLIEKLQYHGIGNTQFLVDQQSGKISFLEISPRMGAAFAVTVPCGFDFSKAGLRLAVGDRVSSEILPRDYATGRRVAWITGDIVGLVSSVRSREIGASQAAVWLWRSIRSAVAADIHATWSWQDPQPTLATVSGLLGRLWHFLTSSKNG